MWHTTPQSIHISRGAKITTRLDLTRPVMISIHEWQYLLHSCFCVNLSPFLEGDNRILIIYIDVWTSYREHSCGPSKFNNVIIHFYFNCNPKWLSSLEILTTAWKHILSITVPGNWTYEYKPGTSNYIIDQQYIWDENSSTLRMPLRLRNHHTTTHAPFIMFLILHSTSLSPTSHQIKSMNLIQPLGSPLSYRF